MQQPATDPLEQRTWAAIRIYAAQRCVTRWLERESQEELDTIYVPAFPLARWVVMNWWALLNESCPDEVPPTCLGVRTQRQRAWLQRHCLRSAEAGLFLPRLLLWSDGRHLCAQWSPDPDDAYSSMPGHFLYGSTVLLNAGEAEDALRAFVTTVLRWIEDVPDPQAARLRANWAAIKSRLVEEIDIDFGVYDGTTFKLERFAAYLAREGIPWPRLESGRLDLYKDTFRGLL